MATPCEAIALNATRGRGTTSGLGAAVGAVVSGGQQQGRRWRLSNSFSGAPMWTAAGSTPLPPHPHPAPPSHPRCCYPVAGVAASAVRMSIIAFELRVSILHRPSPQSAEVAFHPNLGDASRPRRSRRSALGPASAGG